MLPIGEISNRNFIGVNPHTSHLVQLTGERQHADALEWDARGEKQVASVEPGRRLRTVARAAGRGLVMLLLLGCLIAASFRLNGTGWHKWYYWVVRGAFGLLALVLAYVYMRTSEYIRRLDAPRDPKDNIRLITLNDHQLQTLKVTASNARAMGLGEAQIFALATTYPATLRQRIFERYEPERRTMHHSVSMAIKIPQAQLGLLDGSAASIDRTGADGSQDPPGPGNLAEETDSAEAPDADARSDGHVFSISIPAVILPKGALNDDFSVYGGGDEELPAYSYTEYLQLAARVLHVLLTNAFAIPVTGTAGESGQASTPSELSTAVQDAENVALRSIIRRGSPNEDEIRTAVAGIKSLQRSLPPLSGGLPREESDKLRQQAWTLLQLAAKFVETLSYDYAIVVPASCRADGRIGLRYERTVVPSLQLSRRTPGRSPAKLTGWLMRSFKDRLRLLLGARPVDLTISLENACTSQSFHLMVVCPDGLYLKDQNIPHINEYLHNNARPMNVPPYCRLRRRLGQPYAHFYSRYFPEPKEKRQHESAGQPDDSGKQSPRAPYLYLVFHEVPPASIFRASLVAVSTALLIWLVGLVVSHIPNGDPGTDVPAFLLVFPAVIAAWLGFDAPSRRLLEGTLGGRLSLMFSALSAVAASGLFMIYKTKLGMLHGEFPRKIAVFGIGQISWALLVGLAGMNALYACYFAFIRSWQFTHLSSRAADEDTTQGG
jgi:hypothetical protein